MYYFECLEILKENKGYLTSKDIFELYEERLNVKPNEQNLLKALAKLRRRDDINFMSYKRTYIYKYLKP